VYRFEDAIKFVDGRLKERGVITRIVTGRLIEGLLKIGILYPE